MRCAFPLLCGLMLFVSAPLAQNPDSDLAREQARLGLALYLQGRYEVARDLLVPVAEILPEDLRVARYALFATFHADSLDEERYGALRKAAEAEGSSAHERSHFADAAYLKGDLDDAWLQAHALEGEGGGNPYLMVLLSRLHNRLSDRVGRREYARRAHGLAPDDPVVTETWASALAEAGDTDQAREILEAGLQDWPTSLNMTLRLRALLHEAGEVEGAADLLRQARILSPDAARVRQALAQAAREEGRFEEWIALRRALLEEDPDNARARGLLSEAYHAAGHLEVARAVLEEGLHASPDDRQIPWYLEPVEEGIRQTRGEGVEDLVWEEVPPDWPPVLEPEEFALVLLEVPDNGWSTWLGREIVRHREVAEALDDMPAIRLTAGEAPEAFASLASDGEDRWEVPALVALGPAGRVLYRASRDAGPEEVARGLRRARRKTEALIRWGGQEIPWAPSLEEALERARASGQPVLAYFPGEGEWGDRMEETLAGPEMLGSLLEVVPVRLSGDSLGEEPVPVKPSVLFLDPEGRLVYRALGYRRPSVLQDDLDKAVERVSEAETMPVSPEWLGDVAFALHRAEELGRHVVMDIYTDWCGPCRQMDRETFTDPELVRSLDTLFIPVKLNPEVNEDEGKAWSPGSFPTNYLVRSDGLLLKEIEGREPEDYLESLDAVQELALLERIGEEAYRRRQDRRRLLQKMLWRDLNRSARTEAEALIAEGEKGLHWILAHACEQLDDSEGAREAYLDAFAATEEPHHWLVGAAMNTFGEDEDAEAAAGRYQDLIRDYRGRPAHQAAIWLGYASDRQARDEPQQALEAARKSLRLHRTSAARLVLARLHLERGEPAVASGILDPTAEDGEAMEHIYLAWIAEERGSLEEMNEHLTAAREMDGNVGQQAYWSGRQAEREEEQKGRDEAEDPAWSTGPLRWYRTAMVLEPEDPSILNQYGYYLARQDRDLDEAVEVLRQAVALAEEEDDSSLPNYLDSLAWALHRRGDHEEALETMRRVLGEGGVRARGNKTLGYHLGAIYGALGLTGLAGEELEQVALEEAPEEDDRSEAAEARRLLDRYRSADGAGTREATGS